MSKMIVLGIETSCDDTSVCLLRGTAGEYEQFPEILSHNSFSQETLFKKWGGVVPEIASRNHLEKLAPLLEVTFEKAGISQKEVNLIAVTTHPGLLGPLLTGLNAAKTLSLILKVPLLPVNHLYAHLEAIHLTDKVSYPYLGLLVSGGNSLYLLVRSSTIFEVLGTTIDDAAGEAFDKGGKILGLGYPAGRIIDDLAKKGDKNKYHFPIGLTGSGDANLSYSGVKTALRVLIEKNPSSDINDVCASYQEAIVQALKKKLTFATEMAKEKTGRQSLPVVVGGGVACNGRLRQVLGENENPAYFVKPSFCTDNGAMIANYALRTSTEAIPYPDSLRLDAKDRFIKRGEHP